MYHATYDNRCCIYHWLYDYVYSLASWIQNQLLKVLVIVVSGLSLWPFFISRGFVKTGLGRRIALQFVKLFGKKTLGLAYSLVGVDLILAPATPSNTARAGGIMFPIIKSLSESFGSTPKDGTERKMGAF